MPQTTVRLDLDQALDVERNLLAKISFNAAFCFNHLTNLVELILIEGSHLDIRIDPRLLKNLESARVANAVNVREGDPNLLVSWQIDAGNTCHGVPFG